MKISVFLIPILVLGSSGCSLTTTRPIQEMSNAEVAIKAAKDLNADSLVPEMYRNATDYYFKAKRDFRLKDFDNAKKHALRAMRLAEQAEFEAYRLGGATPEASAKLNTPEGSLPDPEAEFKTQIPSGEPSLSPSTPPSDSGTATKPPEAEKGTDYNQLLKDQEAQKEAEKKAAEEEAKKNEKKPGGPTGPSAIKQPAVVDFPPKVVPQTSALPGVMPGAPQSLTDPNGEKPPDLTPYKGSDLPWLNLDEPEKLKSHRIQNFPEKPFEDFSGSDSDSKTLHSGPIKDLNAGANPVKEGLDDVKYDEMKDLQSQTKEIPLLFDKNKLHDGKDVDEKDSEGESK